MKIQILFEKSFHSFDFDQSFDFAIYLFFTETTYEEFYDWLDKTEKRRLELAEKYNYFIDISYSEKAIKFSKL